MNFLHPAFSPYQSLIDQVNPHDSIASLNTLAAKLNLRHDNGNALSFETGDLPRHAADYEQRIFSRACIPTRENNLHDWLNALVWLRFPRLKSALNIRHCRELELPEERRQRGKLRDQLTLLDESGVLIASPRKDLLDLLQEKRWVDLFWHAREAVVRHMTFIVVGHGLLEKCTRPFASMTGKCLLLETTETFPEKLDLFAASVVKHAQMLTLPPLPIQGVPGWDSNRSIDYYQNACIFRTKNHQGLVPHAHS